MQSKTPKLTLAAAIAAGISLSDLTPAHAAEADPSGCDKNKEQTCAITHATPSPSAGAHFWSGWFNHTTDHASENSAHTAHGSAEGESHAGFGAHAAAHGGGGE